MKAAYKKSNDLELDGELVASYKEYPNSTSGIRSLYRSQTGFSPVRKRAKTDDPVANEAHVNGFHRRNVSESALNLPSYLGEPITITTPSGKRRSLPPNLEPSNEPINVEQFFDDMKLTAPTRLQQDLYADELEDNRERRNLIFEPFSSDYDTCSYDSYNPLSQFAPSETTATLLPFLNGYPDISSMINTIQPLLTTSDDYSVPNYPLFSDSVEELVSTDVFPLIDRYTGLAMMPATGGYIAPSMLTNGDNSSTPVESDPLNVDQLHQGSSAAKKTKQGKNLKKRSGKSQSKSETVDDTPRDQDLKFEGDLYTPSQVRFRGTRKEGLCDQCTPSLWFQLKNSNFWYHKQYTHGISSITGKRFHSPLAVRAIWHAEATKGDKAITYLSTEGKCQECCNWVSLVKNKRRHSHTYESLQLALSDISRCGALLSKIPLQRLVTKDDNGLYIIPSHMNVSQANIADYLKEALHSPWFKHAAKCN